MEKVKLMCVGNFVL